MGARAELDGLEEYGKLGGTVFAESEVVSRIAEGRATEEIVAGIHAAIANRIGAMLKRVGVQKLIALEKVCPALPR